MPEGDAILAIAQKLAPRLVGKTLERVTTQGLARVIAGQRVARVTAHGKHLVIELDDGAQARMHLGMNGRVRCYGRARGEAILARTSPGRVSLALVTADDVVVWIGARTVEISGRRGPMRGLAVAALGPDVLADDFDCRQAASRAATHAVRSIADVLLDQRVACGIGNIYKNESLFLRGIDPRTPVGALPVGALEALYATARDLMIARGRDFFVYSRTAKPCRRCGAAIECYAHGDPPRWTWSCPLCQSLRTNSGVNR